MDHDEHMDEAVEHEEHEADVEAEGAAADDDTGLPPGTFIKAGGRKGKWSQSVTRYRGAAAVAPCPCTKSDTCGLQSPGPMQFPFRHPAAPRSLPVIPVKPKEGYTSRQQGPGKAARGYFVKPACPGTRPPLADTRTPHKQRTSLCSVLRCIYLALYMLAIYFNPDNSARQRPGPFCRCPLRAASRRWLARLRTARARATPLPRCASGRSALM